MDKTYRLLQKIKKRPGLYIGTVSLECLRAFLCGYKQQELENYGMCQPDCLDGFTEYIQKKHGLCTDYDWAGVIRFFRSQIKMHLILSIESWISF